MCPSCKSLLFTQLLSSALHGPPRLCSQGGRPRKLGRSEWPQTLCRVKEGPAVPGDGEGEGAAAPQEHGLLYLLLALGAYPHALGCCLEGRVQAAEVVGPWAGTAGLQVGPSLAGGTVLIVGDLVLEETGGWEAGQPGWELGGWGAGPAWGPALPPGSQQLGRGGEGVMTKGTQAWKPAASGSPASKPAPLQVCGLRAAGLGLKAPAVPTPGPAYSYREAADKACPPRLRSATLQGYGCKQRGLKGVSSRGAFQWFDCYRRVGTGNVFYN